MAANKVIDIDKELITLIYIKDVTSHLNNIS